MEIYRFCIINCTEVQVGFSCGSFCCEYEPRNGKCGICKFLRKYRFKESEAKEKIMEIIKGYAAQDVNTENISLQQ